MCIRIGYFCMDTAVRCEVCCTGKRDPEEMYADTRRVHRAPKASLESIEERASQERNSESTQGRRSHSLEMPHPRKSDEKPLSGEDVRATSSIARDDSTGDMPRTMTMSRGPRAPFSIDETETWPAGNKVENNLGEIEMLNCMDIPKRQSAQYATYTPRSSFGSMPSNESGRGSQGSEGGP